MQEASSEDNLGVVFLVAGRKITAVPAPLTIEVESVSGQANRRKMAWSIMIPFPASPEQYPVGTEVKDTRNRIFKVYRYELKRMCLEIFVTDKNR